ncbi:hypothetical protein DCC79_01080, partial [bacterium]
MPGDARTALAVGLYAALLIGPGLAVLAALGTPGGGAGGDAAAADRDASASAPRSPAPWAIDPGVRLGLAAGIGLALQPLAYLWARTLGIP